GAGGPPGPTVETGVRVRTPGDPPPREVTVTGQLEREQGEPAASIDVVRHGWHQPERGEPRRFARIKIRLWSIEPNDLEGVRFGVRRYVWRPNVSDAEYEAYLARLRQPPPERVVVETDAQAELERYREEEEARRRRAAELAAEAERRRGRGVVVETDAKAELERYRKEEEARRRRAAEAERQRARAAAEAERQRQRKAFCASHPEDRGCWGAGGMQMHLALNEREHERERYCAANREDARCWTQDDRWRRQLAWRKRVEVATAPPKQPDGPPPAALAETMPPKLSANAEWRPGYWQWTGSTWGWLGGMWRVPESDIAAEKTTTAPEAPPPPPMAATIWVAGFWQWSGSAWVWVPGSWQLRPEAGASWRPAEWQTRGRVHVLIPGGWVRGRGGRR
ncbi:MAG TPA: hypothetical protein VN253_11080, partial [Kofleriaceae bacterium]|nr:hypothetical protein [Kofleriaceae bacterium]